MILYKKAFISIFALTLAACSTTGKGFNAAGLSKMTYGETTLEQASEYLGTTPVDIWQQGDTTLTRWAYKGTLATDAIYLRKELWLRFGADGTFKNIEQTINIPGIYSPKKPVANSTSKSTAVEKTWQQQWEEQKDGKWLEIPPGDSTGIEVHTISN